MFHLVKQSNIPPLECLTTLATSVFQVNEATSLFSANNNTFTTHSIDIIHPNHKGRINNTTKSDHNDDMNPPEALSNACERSHYTVSLTVLQFCAICITRGIRHSRPIIP